MSAITRADDPYAVPNAWLAHNRALLIGLPAAEGAALVEAAGFASAIRRSRTQYTLRGRSNRVNLSVDEEGIVWRARAG